MYSPVRVLVSSMSAHRYEHVKTNSSTAASLHVAVCAFSSLDPYASNPKFFPAIPMSHGPPEEHAQRAKITSWTCPEALTWLPSCGRTLTGPITLPQLHLIRSIVVAATCGSPSYEFR